MLYLVLSLWIINALIILFEKRNLRILIYTGAFGLISALAFLLFGSPDVAMAEAAISAFTMVFFIVCLNRYYGLGADIKDTQQSVPKKINYFRRYGLPLVFVLFSMGLFIYFIPDNIVDPYLKNLYLLRFMEDIGGYNPVTAIYLRYRVYDTMFEALMLVIAVVAAIHLSKFGEAAVKEGQQSEIANVGMAIFALRITSPILLIFGIYLIANGHITAGGGFQGGLLIATFFVVRYMVYNVYDLPVDKIVKIEKAVFITIALLAAAIVFQGLFGIMDVPPYQELYLIFMNILIGAKVACSFILLFYRFIAIERK